MTDITINNPAPKPIPLATGLSPRSDRAEGRAVRLAAYRSAGLHVVAVMGASGDGRPAVVRGADSGRIETELYDLNWAGLDLCRDGTAILNTGIRMLAAPGAPAGRTGAFWSSRAFRMT